MKDVDKLYKIKINVASETLNNLSFAHNHGNIFAGIFNN